MKRSKPVIEGRETQHLGVRLGLLAIPIVCQNLITYGVVLADNLMVGTLGEAAINGLFMASIVQLVLQMILAGIESAMVVLVSQYWGRRAVEPIKDIVATCFRWALGLAGVFCLGTFFFPAEILGFLTSSKEAAHVGAEYLRVVSPSFVLLGANMIWVSAMRSVEVVRIGLVNSIVAFVVNVSLNALLIFGLWGFPAMGVRGAALATLISRCVELWVVFYFVMRLEHVVCFRWRDLLRKNATLANDIICYGTPLMLGQLVWAVNKFSMRFIVGHFESSSSAAVSIAENLDGLLWVGTFGLALAMGIITGKLIGSGQMDRVKRFSKWMQVVFFSIGLVSFLVVIVLGDWFVSFYHLTPQTQQIAKTFLLVLAVSVWGRAYQAPCLMGLVKAGGDTAFVFKNDTFWVFCWVLPSAFVAWKVFHAPDWVVYACLLSDQVTKCFVAFIKINRFRWMKNLTRA